MAASTSTAPAGGTKSFCLLTQDAASDPLNNNLRILWGETRAKCGSTKKAAREGELPPLPRSKVAGHVNDPMCLNWHVMDFCLDNCREKYDHVPYIEEELTDLKEWVSTSATRRAEDDLPRNRRYRRGGGRNK
mmetsp:Transcript_3115/g.6456  ORF Transcript_3115/g.6456 Transcript_3115/m.6456 type:complete len:133 (+) Transcript_3115:339-737(+)